MRFRTVADGGSMAIGWPKLGKNKGVVVAPPGRAQAVQPPSRLPLIGALTTGRQLMVLVALLVVLGGIAGYVAVADNRSATYGTVYVSGSGELRMLSQRIGKAIQTALQGNAPAFRELQDARERFAQSLSLLANGGRHSGLTL